MENQKLMKWKMTFSTQSKSGKLMPGKIAGMSAFVGDVSNFGRRPTLRARIHSRAKVSHVDRSWIGETSNIQGNLSRIS